MADADGGYLTEPPKKGVLEETNTDERDEDRAVKAKVIFEMKKKRMMVLQQLLLRRGAVMVTVVVVVGGPLSSHGLTDLDLLSIYFGCILGCTYIVIYLSIYLRPPSCLARQTGHRHRHHQPATL